MFAMWEISCPPVKATRIPELRSGYLHPCLLIGDTCNKLYINIQMFLIVELLSKHILSSKYFFQLLEFVSSFLFQAFH
jgi:hypothetical protein